MSNDIKTESETPVFELIPEVEGQIEENEATMDGGYDGPDHA